MSDTLILGLQGRATLTVPFSPMNSTDRSLLDVEAAAQYLRSIGWNGVTVHLIRSIIARGEIPYLWIGKKFYLTQESLDLWLKTHEQPRH